MLYYFVAVSIHYQWIRDFNRYIGCLKNHN